MQQSVPGIDAVLILQVAVAAQLPAEQLGVPVKQSRNFE
jgi:hypothetical protein